MAWIFLVSILLDFWRKERQDYNSILNITKLLFLVVVLKLPNIEAWFWKKNQPNGVERCQVSWWQPIGWISSGRTFRLQILCKMPDQSEFSQSWAGKTCLPSWNLEKSEQKSCVPTGLPPQHLPWNLQSILLRTQRMCCYAHLCWHPLCGGQTSRKTHLLYPVLSIKYPCSPINIYMDSNKTIVITVESTQVTSGHSCPLHNLQIILCNTMKGSITFPSPVHSIFLHSSPGSKVVVTSCQPDDRFMDQTLTIGSWQIWDTIRVYWVLMSIDVRFMYVIWMYFDVLHPIFFLSARNSNGSQCKRFHITPLVDGSLPLFGGNTRFTRFDAILGNSQLNPSYRRTFWCTFLYSNMDGQFAKWRLFPTRWGSLDFKKGAPSTLSSSLNHSCLPPSSGCSGPRLDPNTCQKKCQKKCQKECQNRCHIMQEYARYHVRIDV